LELLDDFHLRKKYVVQLREEFLRSGAVIVIDTALQGQGSINTKASDR